MATNTQEARRQVVDNRGAVQHLAVQIIGAVLEIIAHPIKQHRKKKNAELESLAQNAFNMGYNFGVTKGYEAGYKDGLDEGFNIGKNYKSTIDEVQKPDTDRWKDL